MYYNIATRIIVIAVIQITVIIQTILINPEVEAVQEKRKRKSLRRKKKSIATLLWLFSRVMVKGPDGELVEREEANYKVTGALGKDKSTGVMYNGVLLKVYG